MSGHEYEIGALLRVIVAEHYPCCVRRGKAEALADELADDLRPYVARVAATARADEDATWRIRVGDALGVLRSRDPMLADLVQQAVYGGALRAATEDRCTCGVGDHRPPGAHGIHCADPDASAFYAEHYSDWTVHELPLMVYVPLKDNDREEALTLVQGILTDAALDIRVRPIPPGSTTEDHP